MRLPPPLVGTVETLADGRALIRLSDGEARDVPAPDEIQIDLGMSVSIYEFPDGSAPIIAWGL